MTKTNNLAPLPPHSPAPPLLCSPAFLQKRPAPARDYQMELLDGEILLFHPSHLTIIHSNESGALIWQLCNGQRTVGNIVTLLQAAYPDSAAAIESDVCQTLELWREHGAIEWQ